MFMQTLIDDYILPLLGSDNPDFSGLLHAIIRVGGFMRSVLYLHLFITGSWSM